VLAVRQQIDTLFLADRLTRRAADRARTIVARGVSRIGPVALVATRSTVRGVSVEIHAVTVANAVASDALERADAALAAARRVSGRAADFPTSTAVVLVRVGVGARTVTIRGSAGALSSAHTIQAHLVLGAGVITTAAIEPVLREVDTAPRVALGKARIAHDAAALVAHCLGVRGCRTGCFTRTAMRRVDFRIDANPGAVELTRRAFAPTLGVGANSVIKTAIFAGATVHRVGRHVDAGVVALCVARVTHDSAGSVDAAGLASGSGVASVVAGAAVVRIAFEIAARAVAQSRVPIAAQLAHARAARGTALLRRRALGAALAAVEHAGC